MSKARDQYYRFKSESDAHFAGLMPEIHEYVRELELRNIEMHKRMESAADFLTAINSLRGILVKAGALSKQIQFTLRGGVEPRMAPLQIGDEHAVQYLCPSCNFPFRETLTTNMRYCFNCGVKLDWSEWERVQEGQP